MYFVWGVFTGGLVVKNLPANTRRHRRRGFDPRVRKIPWRRIWQPTPVFLPGEFHGQRSLAGYSPWGCNESDTTEQLSTHTGMPCISLEKMTESPGLFIQVPHAWWINNHQNAVAGPVLVALCVLSSQQTCKKGSTVAPVLQMRIRKVSHGM